MLKNFHSSLPFFFLDFSPALLRSDGLLKTIVQSDLHVQRWDPNEILNVEIPVIPCDVPIRSSSTLGHVPNQTKLPENVVFPRLLIRISRHMLALYVLLLR